MFIGLTNCSAKLLPQQTFLRGYVDYFRQNLSDYPIETDPLQISLDALNIFLGLKNAPGVQVYGDPDRAVHLYCRRRPWLSRLGPDVLAGQGDGDVP